MANTPFGSDSLPFRIQATSPVPPYEQIRGQLSVMVAAGRVGPGSRLPTVRALADQLGLAPGTVARAYRELELDGTVEGRGRKGTFVSDDPPDSEAVTQRRTKLAAAAEVFAQTALRLGAREEEAVAALREVFTMEPRG